MNKYVIERVGGGFQFEIERLFSGIEAIGWCIGGDTVDCQNGSYYGFASRRPQNRVGYWILPGYTDIK